jgi:hypothetical protein
MFNTHVAKITEDSQQYARGNKSRPSIFHWLTATKRGAFLAKLILES